MTKNSKIILLIFSILFISHTVRGQERIKLYFLADTINIRYESRILNIEDEGPLHLFQFYCKCIPESKWDPVFTYHTGQVPGEITKEKPSYQYISWKELAEMLHREKFKFDLKYNLFITEVLPGEKYKTNQVRLVRIRDLLY